MLIPLRFLARRAKLYAAFNRFRYQRHEISYALDDYSMGVELQPQESELLKLAVHFLGIVLAYDFWTTTHAWPAVELTHMCAESTFKMIGDVIAGESIESILGSRIDSVPVSDDLCEFLFVSDIRSTFDRLANLGNMFEEVCREWFLPTFLGTLAEKHALR